MLSKSPAHLTGNEIQPWTSVLPRITTQAIHCKIPISPYHTATLFSTKPQISPEPQDIPGYKRFQPQKAYIATICFHASCKKLKKVWCNSNYVWCNFSYVRHSFPHVRCRHGTRNRNWHKSIPAQKTTRESGSYSRENETGTYTHRQNSHIYCTTLTDWQKYLIIFAGQTARKQFINKIITWKSLWLFAPPCL